MSTTRFTTRALVAGLVLATAATSGCSFFRRGNDLYSGPAESRPLEVPPPMDATVVSNTASTTAPVTASGTQQAAATAQGAVGFNVAGERDAVYARLGEVLQATQGVTITSRAQLLGAYDLTYGGASFLVRVSPSAQGVNVSAVDARGLPASGDAPRRLMETVRAALAQ